MWPMGRGGWRLKDPKVPCFQTLHLNPGLTNPEPAQLEVPIRFRIHALRNVVGCGPGRGNSNSLPR